MNEAIEVIRPGELAVVENSPTLFMNKASQVAGLCKAIVVATAMDIKGRKYVKVEGWQAIATAHGYVASARDVEDVVGGVRAIAELRRIDDGTVLCSAEGFVGDDEPMWQSRPMYARRAMAQCVPLSAEILTRRGFLKHHEVVVGDEVLGLDLASGTTRWCDLLAINVFADGETFEFGHRTFRGVRCTMGHTWPVRIESTGKIELVPLGTKGLARGSIVTAAPMDEAGANLLDVDPDDAARLGWVLTDGCIYWQGRSPSIHVDQSKEQRFHDLDRLFSGVRKSTIDGRDRTFPTGKTYTCLPSTRWNLSAERSRKLLATAGITSKDDPAILGFVTRLSGKARMAMLEAMIAADGSRKSEAPHRGYFSKQSETVRQVFQILCAMEGIGLGRSQMDKEQPRQTFRARPEIHTPSLVLNQSSASEPVWCPTTSLGTWVMRDAGMVTLTGNTRGLSRVCRSAFAHVVVMMNAGLETTPAEEMSSDEAPRQGWGQQVQAPAQAQAPAAARQNPTSVITEKQLARLWAISRGSKWTTEQVHALIGDAPYGYEHAKDIKVGDYDAIVSAVKEPPTEVVPF
jgi:hypothetical protein